ncbi:MAG: hypothetical protein D5R98_02830 [Desulfonatronovibrio sp. MSAO_Bac4]|nr:MAG: hypothetical protein D5R98_02830 [Desulfonatronovibrio sp. MSAO_Bac4]
MAIREIIKPESETYTIHIPKNYLHREVEVILLPVFSSSQKHVPAQRERDFEPALYHGASSATKDEVDKYLQTSRDEWQL